jgi:hypothetical protein
MASRKISQRQAQYYRKQNLELTKTLADQKNRWKSDWDPGWVNIETLSIPDVSFAKITTARLLSHTIIVTSDIGNQLRFYAVKL